MLAAITLALGTECHAEQAGDAPPTDGIAQFWANVDTDNDGVNDDTIAFQGNWTRSGEDIDVSVSEQAPAQVGLDSISLDLQLGATEDDGIAGTIDYTRDGTTYEGNVDFERFPEM